MRMMKSFNNSGPARDDAHRQNGIGKGSVALIRSFAGAYGAAMTDTSVPNSKFAPSVSGRCRELRIRKDTSKPYDARVVQVQKFAGSAR
jgi:hypothetical protein